jgi:hypothetical protein
MKLLTNRTADKIRQRVLDVAPGEGAPAESKYLFGARPILVRITSTTAAAGSGVGAQCYPGVIVDPRASATTQTERAAVWLTVLGANGSPIKPKGGGVYPCLLTGNATIGGVTRARAFGAEAPPPSTWTNCTSFLGSLKPGRCYLLTISDAGDGSCSCVPTGQSAKLTYSTARQAHTSSTLLYGCPPGVFTTLCPQPTGAPKKWNLAVAGLTGDFTHFNQNYTTTHSTGESWGVVKGGVTATATQTSAGVWSLTLSDGTTTIVYAAEGVVGCCSAITFTLVDADGADDAPEELTLSPATNCGQGPAYTAILDKCSTECMRNARLRWEPVAGSGAKTILFDPPACGVDADGNKFADFSTDDPLLCTGTEGEGCADNKFTVRITCTSCFATSGRAPCGIDVSCDLEGEYTIPQFLCVTHELTAGVDCIEMDGVVLRMPLVAGPYANPISSGFLGRMSDGTEVVAWGQLTATTTLSSGFVFDNQGAIQCGRADPTSTLSDPYDPNSSPTLPITIRFPATSGVDFTVSFEEGQWLLKYTTNTLVATAINDEAWTVTFDTSSLSGVFGQDEVTFTFGALPMLGYGDLSESGRGISALPWIGYNLGYVTMGVLLGDACFLLRGETGLATGRLPEEGLDECIVANYSTTFYDITIEPDAECEENPVPPTYVCVNGDCVEVYDGSGTTLVDCAAACGGSVTWDCIDGTCIQVNGAGGEFATQALCLADCGGSLTYDCVNGECVPVEGPDGAFATLAGCQAECTCVIADGAEVYLDVPDGPRAGLWTGHWEVNYDGLGGNRVIFGNGEGDAPFPFNVFSSPGTGAGPQWYHNGTGGFGNIPAEDIDCGPPVSLRIDGAVLGSSGDVYVHT